MPAASTPISFSTTLRAVYNVVRSGAWRTINEIAEKTGLPPQSVSARLRDLRKAQFGGHDVERTLIGESEYAYRFRPNPSVRIKRANAVTA